MKTNFDINKKNKKMPYTVPEGFFDKLEDDIWNKISNEPIEIKKKRNALSKSIVIKSIASIAAVVAIIFGMTIIIENSNHYSDIDSAFNRLSVQDQNFMIEIYEDDIMLYN